MRLNLARGCFHLISLPLPAIVQACTGPGWAYCLLLLGLVSKLLPEPFISSVLPAAPKLFFGGSEKDFTVLLHWRKCKRFLQSTAKEVKFYLSTTSRHIAVDIVKVVLWHFT